MPVHYYMLNSWDVRISLCLRSRKSHLLFKGLYHRGRLSGHRTIYKKRGSAGGPRGCTPAGQASFRHCACWCPSPWSRHSGIYSRDLSCGFWATGDYISSSPWAPATLSIGSADSAPTTTTYSGKVCQSSYKGPSQEVQEETKEQSMHKFGWYAVPGIREWWSHQASCRSGLRSTFTETYWHHRRRLDIRQQGLCKRQSQPCSPHHKRGRPKKIPEKSLRR